MQINVSLDKWQHMQQMMAIGELATGIVHDFKNQLACIGTNVSLIETMNGQLPVDKYIVNINRQLGYANEMTQLILKLGSGDTNYREFDLALLMEDVTSFFTRTADQRIDVSTYVDEGTHFISGCQSLISNSILNLCANARDAIADLGSIEISLTRCVLEDVSCDALGQEMQGAYVVLAVQDSGCGIAPNQLTDIFEPFFTTKGATSEKIGLGLGLSNVVQTVREHNANLTIDSELGKGTTFKLYFKAAS